MSAPRVAVLDYGSGNLHSVTRALAAAGADVVLTADRSLCLDADGLVVPGVGAFAACMEGLRDVDADEIVITRLADETPTLGICVGHQVLFDTGVEHGLTTAGLGFLPGVVEQLDARPLPHMGWNTVQASPGSSIFAGIEHERFYFVHSYAAHDSGAWPKGTMISTSEHGGDRFVAAVECGALWSTQFHPEKSGAAGARLLRNWIATLGKDA